MMSATPMTSPILGLNSSSWIACSLAVIGSWFRSWFTSGAAVETLLLLSCPTQHWSVSRYRLLVALTSTYVFASASWLSHLAFATVCWPLVFVTCLVDYAAVSSFTRGRLRYLLKHVHFYDDKVAFFDLPSVVIDNEYDGLITVRGLTINLLNCSIELHGIEFGLDLGSGHELSIHSDALVIKLFRHVTIDEVYGVHWFAGTSNDSSQNPRHRADSHTDSYLDSTTSQNKKNLINDHILPVSEETLAQRERDNCVLPKSAEERQHHTADKSEGPAPKPRRPSPGDIDAKERYDHVLHELYTTNRLYQSRTCVKAARGSRKHPTEGSPDTRSAVCADLRNTRPAMSPPSSRIALSTLIDFFTPVMRLLDQVPFVLRLMLSLLSQSHPISCPSICFSASGLFLGGMLIDKLFRSHAADDNRIAELKREVSQWLNAADIYIDLNNLCGQGAVPLRTTPDITADIRSADVVITRISADAGNTGRVAQIKGIDSSFCIPTCLLRAHAYLVPPPLPLETKKDDVAPVHMSIRATLPVHFSDTFLNFAATLSKTIQMLDIEEEAGLASSKDSASSVDGSSSTRCSNGSQHLHKLREKVVRGRVGVAIKQPVMHAKRKLQKEMKEATVDKINGAWFAEWTNNLLKRLEWLDGDVGYSTEIAVRITRARG